MPVSLRLDAREPVARHVGGDHSARTAGAPDPAHQAPGRCHSNFPDARRADVRRRPAPGAAGGPR